MSSSQISNKRSQKKDNSKISDRTLNSNTGLKMQSLVDTTRNTFLEWGKYAVEQFWHYEDKPPETFCDWLTFVSPSTGISEDTLSEIINEVMIGTFWGKEYQVEQYDSKMSFFRGGAYFNYKYVSEIGAKLSTRKLDSGLTIAFLSLSGGVLSQIFKRNDLLSVALFINYMVDKGFHISRCDFSIDDFQKKLDVFLVSDWVRRGNYQFFQNKRIIESGGLIKDKNLTTGLTIECGSRESDFFGRIYDTFKKHKKNATRYEGEFKDKKAKNIQDLLLLSVDNYLHGCNENLHGCNENEEDWLYGCNERLLSNIQNILLHCISFCDRNKGKRIDTKIVYPEFIEWIEYKKYINKNLEKRRFVTRPKKPSIKRSWDFLNKSVKGTLSLFKILGKDIFNNLIEYLLIKDKEKRRPEIINKDRNLLIAELKTHGINAIFNEVELQQIFNEYGLDFGTNTSYYEPKIIEDSLTANKKILRSVLKEKKLPKNYSLEDEPHKGKCLGILNENNKLRLEDELESPLMPNNYFTQGKTLYEDILDLENYKVIEFLYKKVPSLFTQLIDKLSNQEREIIREHCEQLT